MRSSHRLGLVCGLLLHGFSSILHAQSATPGRGQGSEKAVLVELFVSHGCNLCPRAEQVLGELAEEFGPEQVVPISFHVDYFNKPWKDPFSSVQNSRREAQYSLLYDKANKVGKPDYLYLTPLVMIAGRTPMVASNAEVPVLARKAIRAALREPAEVRLSAGWVLDDPSRPAVRVEVSPRTPRASDRNLLVGVVVWEDRLETPVESGENAGVRYLNRYVVRSLDVKPAMLSLGQVKELVVPVSLAAGGKPERSGVAVYVQEESTGRILQAARRPWPVAGTSAPVAAAESPASAAPRP